MMLAASGSYPNIEAPHRLGGPRRGPPAGHAESLPNLQRAAAQPYFSKKYKACQSAMPSATNPCSKLHY